MIDAFPEAKERVPALRMIVVAGPRIDPATLPQAEGLEIRRYVHDLYRHLAACDLAVVQGGLTTSMELTANRRPFIYFPLATTSSRTSTCATDSSATAPAAAWTSRRRRRRRSREAIADEIGRVVDYRPVETDGAARAAALIAELLRSKGKREEKKGMGPEGELAPLSNNSDHVERVASTERLDVGGERPQARSPRSISSSDVDARHESLPVGGHRASAPAPAVGHASRLLPVEHVLVVGVPQPLGPSHVSAQRLPVPEQRPPASCAAATASGITPHLLPLSVERA